jgi:uncharacterized membrane protein
MRSVSVAALLAAAVAAIVGSFLDWVRLTAPEDLPISAEAQAALAEQMSQPFSGVEARDGWWVIGAAAVIIVSGVMLLMRKRSGYAWLAFLAAVLMGSIVFADYRGIGDISSSISQRMDIVGRADVGIGLTMVAAAVIVAVIGSLIGVAATPRQDD